MSKPAPGAAAEVALVGVDPFGYWPAYASRLEGLGGETLPPDRAYVFHTEYLAFPEGRVALHLEVQGLGADEGELVLRVNAQDAEGRAETVVTQGVSLLELSAGGRKTPIVFVAEPDKRYAFLGHLYGAAPAEARGLAVWSSAFTDSPRYARALAEARRTIFGANSFRQAPAMVSPDKATLTDPVSQTCTSSQFSEPVYSRWLERMQLPMHRHRKQWEFVYILQVLNRYGRLAPGARGLGFGVGREPLPAVMAAGGCMVTASDLPVEDERAGEWNNTTQHAASREQLRYPRICGDDVFNERVRFEAVDMNAIPDHLRDFDFTWSACALEHLGSIEAGKRFIENSIDRLRPGGLAVHTTELNLSSNTSTIDNDATVLFRRRDLEQLALNLVSYGHKVAQLKFDLGDRLEDDYVDVPPYNSDPHLKLALGAYVTTSFGLVVQRGDR